MERLVSTVNRKWLIHSKVTKPELQSIGTVAKRRLIHISLSKTQHAAQVEHSVCNYNTYFASLICTSNRNSTICIQTAENMSTNFGFHY